MRMYCTYQTTPLLPDIFLFWFRAAYETTTGELRPRNGPLVCKMLAFVGFSDFCLRIPGVAHIVRPHPDYWTHALHCVTSLLAGNCQTKQKLDYSFLYLHDLEDQFSAMEMLTMGRDRQRYRYVGNSLIILLNQSKTKQTKTKMQW